MKYFLFVFALMFSSAGCASSLHSPDSYVKYEYVYVPVFKRKVISYHHSHPYTHIHKSKRVRLKRFPKVKRRHKHHIMGKSGFYVHSH